MQSAVRQAAFFISARRMGKTSWCKTRRATIHRETKEACPFSGAGLLIYISQGLNHWWIYFTSFLSLPMM